MTRTALVDRSDRPTLDGFEPFAPEYLRNPFPVWARALHECPVFYHPELDFWVLTRWADIAAATADWQTFSNRATDFVPAPERFVEKVGRNFFGDNSLLASDPPQHTASRAAANRSFTRKRVAEAESFVRATAAALIDDFYSEGRCELMRRYAYQISQRTIVHMLGLPESDMPLFTQWAQDHFALMAPRSAVDSEQAGNSAHRMPDEERVERWSRVVDAVDYFHDVIEDRRSSPREDMISDMVQATGEDGQPALTDERIIVHAQEMISAGNDTTANLIGVTTMFLTADRSQLDRVQRDPALTGKAVEEALRRHGSARGMFRWTTRDVTVSGVTIPANSNVYLAFQASGIDGEHFTDPLRYDIDRPNADEHLAFGRGRHFCLGAPLARLEANVAVRSLIERLPALRLTPGRTLDYVPVITGAILQRLDVEWD